MRTIFMGSGLLAAPILSRIAQQHQVVAVLTAGNADKIATIKANPVISLAEALNIPTRYASKRFTESDIAYVSDLNPDIIIVASYGVIIPESVLKLGSFPPLNVHPSLLPHWRGAAPIERAIEAKANEIVVSIIEVVAALDAGDVFMYDRLPITNNLPLSVIYEKCAIMGAEMLLKTMEALKEGKAHKAPQASIDPQASTAYAKKISKQELELDFNLDAITLHRKIWAFSLAGGCYFTRNGERIKILEAEYSLDNNLDDTSSVNGYLNLQTGTIKTVDGYIIPCMVQREGKRPLPAAGVWRGLR